jgi:hypothetical protein
MATGIGRGTHWWNNKLRNDIHTATAFMKRFEIALLVLFLLWCRIGKLVRKPLTFPPQQQHMINE